MATGHDLDERSREVLRALIELHIQTGEPVGSESLSNRLNRQLSPATLRNIMADLERQGFLDHPHTSAGRQPTDEGYRFFVDSLIRTRPLAAREARAIDSELSGGTPGQVLESASHLLSRMTRNVGFVLAPDLSRSSFGHIDLVALAQPRVLVVMVSRSGLVTNKVIELEEELGSEELQACANYLNAHFAGLSLLAIRARLLEMMSQEKAAYDSLLRHVVSVGERAFAQPEGQEASVYLDGASNILEQPRIEDMERLKALFRTFEEKSRLVRILNACIAGDGVRIFIGRENLDPGLRDVALVTAGRPLEQDVAVGVGVLGPPRMEYARVIALVDHVARAVARALGEPRT
ncbi:MAG: heat-inducible transcriptional repressor HrcA [Vicinamibacteria bacterium]